ncbi:M3 family metallopeptidase [Roseateles sp. LKC17W]|uniref:M3 family metallopeptidase n=1 Tax=Pelomonas margarita TaxID=3299031 RepID=A0ABW7FLT7_9BURK
MASTDNRNARNPERQSLLRSLGKSSGAYQSGVYGLTPLVLLNHQGSFYSLSTFAHERGHGMHTVLAKAAPPFETAGYPLFLAEIEKLLAQKARRPARFRAIFPGSRGLRAPGRTDRGGGRYNPAIDSRKTPGVFPAAAPVIPWPDS